MSLKTTFFSTTVWQRVPFPPCPLPLIKNHEQQNARLCKLTLVGFVKAETINSKKRTETLANWPVCLLCIHFLFLCSIYKFLSVILFFIVTMIDKACLLWYSNGVSSIKYLFRFMGGVFLTLPFRLQIDYIGNPNYCQYFI